MYLAHLSWHWSLKKTAFSATLICLWFLRWRPHVKIPHAHCHLNHCCQFWSCSINHTVTVLWQYLILTYRIHHPSYSRLPFLVLWLFQSFCFSISNVPWTLGIDCVEDVSINAGHYTVNCPLLFGQLCAILKSMC